MTYGEKFIEGAAPPFKITLGLLVVLVLYYISIVSEDPKKGRVGVIHFFQSFFGLIVLLVLISIGLNITMFMGFLNAGGITHALGFYVLVYLLSGFVIRPVSVMEAPVQPTIELAAVQSSFVTI